MHRTLGPGLLESIYSQCLQFELSARKLPFLTQQKVPITYKGMTLDAAHRLDLIVDGRVVVEVKSVTAVLPVHQAQMLTYLALTGSPVGLLINFNETTLMDGVKRLLNKRVPLRRRAERPETEEAERAEDTDLHGDTETRRGHGRNQSGRAVSRGRCHAWCYKPEN